MTLQSIIAINFIFYKDNDAEHVMHSKSDNIEIMINDKILEELFQSLLNSYWIGLETSLIGSDFIFHCVDLLYYKYHKNRLNEVDHIWILLIG